MVESYLVTSNGRVSDGVCDLSGKFSVVRNSDQGHGGHCDGLPRGLRQYRVRNLLSLCGICRLSYLKICL